MGVRWLFACKTLHFVLMNSYMKYCSDRIVCLRRARAFEGQVLESRSSGASEARAQQQPMYSAAMKPRNSRGIRASVLKSSSDALKCSAQLEVNECKENIRLVMVHSCLPVVS